MIERMLSSSLLRVAQAFPVVAILGPRQSGKTTLAKAMFPNHRYISFEDIIAVREEAERDPHGFFNTYKNDHGIIIDEFQHVPSLLSYIQLYVDQERKPGYFILTGSQNFLMSQAIAQTLAGRISLLTLLPLSIGELAGAKVLPETIESLIGKGLYPELFVNPFLTSIDWYQSYIATYLERDVRNIRHVGDLTTFRKFMKLCAARTGQLLNVTSLANDCNITVATANAWISVLEASYAIFLLQPHHVNFNKRLVKSPKLYFIDTGLACSLLGLESTDDVLFSSYRGALVETLIIADIIKSFFNRGRVPRAYFWCDKSGYEIDCLVERGDKLIPIEIKATMTASKELFKGILYWQALAQKAGQDVLEESFVVYAGTETQRRSYGTFLCWNEIGLLPLVAMHD